jgi:hypothetical protein
VQALILALRQMWAWLLFPHAVLLGLSVAALQAIATYRIPGRVIVFVLPAVSVILAGLSALIVVNRLITVTEDHRRRLLECGVFLAVLTAIGTDGAGLVAVSGQVHALFSWSIVVVVVTISLVIVGRRKIPPPSAPVARILTILEQGASVLVGAFILLGLFSFLNGVLDHSGTLEAKSEVRALGTAEVELDEATTLGWVDLRSWRHPDAVERILLHSWERAPLWRRLPVIAHVRSGAYGVPWVSRVSRDDEAHYRKVIEIAPTAGGPRQALIYQYVAQRRWPEVTAVTQDYARLYPHDYKFIGGVVMQLMLAEHYREAVTLLEPCAADGRNREAVRFLGWTLHEMAVHGLALSGRRKPYPRDELRAQSRRGIALLEASLAMKPDDPTTHSYLGWAYRDAGRFPEAIAMFQRLLEQVPGHPDAQRQISRIRARMGGGTERIEIPALSDR